MAPGGLPLRRAMAEIANPSLKAEMTAAASEGV
jgi:hypothetical protein